MMTMFAHVTPQETPAGILLFMAGMAVGTLLTFAILKIRAR